MSQTLIKNKMDNIESTKKCSEKNTILLVIIICLLFIIFLYACKCFYKNRDCTEPYKTDQQRTDIQEKSFDIEMEIQKLSQQQNDNIVRIGNN